MNNNNWQEYSKAIASRILKALEEKGWQKKDLADKCNISPSQITKMVSGELNFTLETLVKIGNALGIDWFGVEKSTLKTYLKSGYKLTLECIEQHDRILLNAAKEQDFDKIELINLEFQKLQAVKTYIEALFETFPHLKS